MTDLIKELREAIKKNSWRESFFHDEAINTSVIKEVLSRYENDKAYPDTHLYTLDEAREIMKKEGKFSGVLKSPTPVERLDGLREEIDKVMDDDCLNLHQKEIRVKNILSHHPSPSVSTAGEVSDGYHTFNELYAHRIALYLALVSGNPGKFWKSKKHEDGSSFDGWFILGGNLGTGDISYHLPLSMWGMAKCEELPVGKKWDGHTPTDVVGRLSIYANHTPVERLEGLYDAIIKWKHDNIGKLPHIEQCALRELLSRHPSPSVSTEELIAEVEKRQPCRNCTRCGHFCECCFWAVRGDNFKPIDGKEAK